MPVAALTLAAHTSASEALSLSWAAPPTCPGAREVELEVDRAIARVAPGVPVKVTAEVTADEAPDTGFALHVVVQHHGETSERTLSVSECAEVARATALFVALAVQSEPSEPTTEAPAPTPPPAEAPPPRPPPAPEPVTPRDEAPVERGPVWAISLGPQAAIGFAPRTDLGADIGVGLSLAVERDFFRALLRGSAFLPTESTVDGTRSGGDFSLLAAGAFGCLGPTVSSVALFGCLGGKLYHLRAEGFGTDADEARSTTIFAAAASLELEWRLTETFFLLAGVEGGYAPETARFVIENVGLVHETGQLLAESRIELGVRF